MQISNEVGSFLNQHLLLSLALVLFTNKILVLETSSAVHRNKNGLIFKEKMRK